MEDNKKEIRLEKSKVMNEIVFLEADFRKLERDKAEIEMELRRLKKQKGLTDIAIQEKLSRMKQLDTRMAGLGLEIKKVKRKLSGVANNNS